MVITEITLEISACESPCKKICTSSCDTLLSDRIINKFKETSVNPENFKSFLRTIDLAVGLDSEHKTISYVDNFSVGITQKNIYGIKITLQNNTVTISHKSILLTQHVPAIYEQKTSCHRGARRYGFFGPRENECNTYYVERGLLSNEINIIESRLMNSYNENKKLLE
jgi:hypothetical protein